MSLPPFPGRRLPRPDPARSVIVVGSGIAGIGAALGLASRGAMVTLVDAAPELGGACRAVELEVPGRGLVSVDVGVSDFNRATFQQLNTLMETLALPLQPVCQSASFRAPDGRWLWSSGPAGAEVAPGIDPRFTAEIARFKAEAPGVTDPRLPMGEWLRQRGFSADLRRLYAVPRALGCFPSPGDDPEAVPMRALARFWGQHGLVGPGPADRVCVRGGMHRYLPAVRARLQALGVRLHLGAAVQRIEREPLQPLAVHTRRGTLLADRLVLAVPPAAALRLLARPTAAERTVLGACRTQPGRVLLHRDPRLMPASPTRWAAYNYLVPGDTRVPGPTITFFPERLGRLQGPLPPMFVTLNPPIEPRGVIAEHVHAHPVFGRDDTMAAALARLQGTRQTWFCGAWTAEPFLHEQGLVSGLAVAADIAAEPARLAA